MSMSSCLPAHCQNDLELMPSGRECCGTGLTSRHQHDETEYGLLRPRRDCNSILCSMQWSLIPSLRPICDSTNVVGTGDLPPGRLQNWLPSMEPSQPRVSFPYDKREHQRPRKGGKTHRAAGIHSAANLTASHVACCWGRVGEK